jgi:hypothetical protein
MKKFGDMAVIERQRPRRILNEIDPSTGPGARAWFENMLRRARTEGVFMVEQDLTDPLARLLLENNDGNRRGSAVTIKEMAKAIKDEAFDGLNGETLKISICGQLNDGQHRCHARLEAGVNFRTRFLFGLPRESRLTIDQGKLRSAGDFLTMGGKEGGNVATAVASLLWMWRNTRNVTRTTTMSRISKSALAAYATENHERIMASINAIPKKGASYVGGLHMMAFAHAILSEKDRAAATDFITRLITGEGLLDGHPILTLRNRFLSNRRMSQAERFELILRAWNAFRADERPNFFQIRKSYPDIAK